MNEKARLKMALEELFKTPTGEQGSIVLPQPWSKPAEDYGSRPPIGRRGRKGRSRWISDSR